jgi:formyltetrahydrofolate deformylase
MYLHHPGLRPDVHDYKGKTLSNSFILTLSCPDRRGIVHACSGFLVEHDCNIAESAQFNDVEHGQFFLRLAFTTQGADLTVPLLREAFGPVAQSFEMAWEIIDAGSRPATIVMVSRLGHCLHDLLLRWRTGLLPVDIKAVVSNHRDFYQLAASYDIPFHHIPVNKGNKQDAEAELMHLVEKEGAELVVLARYMQILSDETSRRLRGRAINIHHSFLPGFKGAKPYYQAHARGVKLIGATAHYVTADLDEGPIIEQDVVRADHAMSPEALTALGRDVESVVLARAVKWHAERRVLLNGNRTVVFR